jgi:predicted transcriptional regulator of viral defense system
LANKQKWTTQEIKDDVESAGVKASAKEIYNAIGYLSRRGHVTRVGYGRYLVDGVAVVTADDLGGEPSTNESE